MIDRIENFFASRITFSKLEHHAFLIMNNKNAGIETLHKYAFRLKNMEKLLINVRRSYKNSRMDIETEIAKRKIVELKIEPCPSF